MNEIKDDLSDIPEEHHELFKDVRDTIANLIEDRKLNWLSNTIEFKEGIDIGLEIAALYGDKINEVYKKYNISTDANDS